MKRLIKTPLFASCFGMLLVAPSAMAQTQGTVSITAKLSDTGNGPEHWTAVWVTKADGTFVRNLRLDGSFVFGHDHPVADHLDAWVKAAAGNVTLDGVTGATATSYTAPNSPFTETWNCTDAKGTTVPDGVYKIWIQYAESSDSPGPVTTNGLAWTKGAAASTLNPPNQGANFTGMKIVWTPGSVVVKNPEIAVQQPVGSNLVDGTAKKSFGTVKVGKSGTAKTFTIKNTGTAPLTGLAVTKNGSNAKDFVVTAPVSKTLAPGASTTFKVTFKPVAAGTRNAAIHIKSNDANENPFDIKLAGLGKK